MLSEVEMPGIGGGKCLRRITWLKKGIINVHRCVCRHATFLEPEAIASGAMKMVLPLFHFINGRGKPLFSPLK